MWCDVVTFNVKSGILTVSELKFMTTVDWFWEV
jgi:hypothetical protein